MIHKISDPDDLAAMRELRRRITSGQGDLSAKWLSSTGARVLAEESGRHLEAGEAHALADALAGRLPASLVAVVVDSLAVDGEAHALNSTAEDLMAISDELGGINFLLSDSTGTWCVLFTADDFKLVAGPFDFVSQILGDPKMVRSAFLEFAADQPDELRHVALRAARYMDWVVER